MNSKQTLIKNLQNKSLYPHPVEYFKCIETHISWVILTGKFAYKIKKPLDFAVLDFSTLEKRKFNCEEELRLNRLLAPDIYLEIVPISGSENNPEFSDKHIIEYAIKMREFPQEKIFLNLLKKQLVNNELIEKLATQIAAFHQRCAAEPPKHIGTAEQVYAPMLQNFEQIDKTYYPDDYVALLTKLETWTRQQYEKLYPVLTQRLPQNFIRECHGDLHLGNIVLINEKPEIFDRIEFNEELRWTDVVADIAFLTMDLKFNQRHDLANVLINTYLQKFHDYQGLKLLKFYEVYRAMVRAKVYFWEYLQHQKKAALTLSQSYLGLAKNIITVNPPKLFLMYGLSGSGKSYVAKQLAAQLDCIILRSDVIRKLLFDGTNIENLYTPAATEATHVELQQLAEMLLTSHFNIIVDATFLQAAQRQKFSKLSTSLNVPYKIIHCFAPIEICAKRIEQRNQMKHDPSDADTEVLMWQAQQQQHLTEGEKAVAIKIDTSQQKEFDFKALLKK